MHLDLKLVPGFDYSTSVHQFPIDVSISTDAPVEIFSRIDIAAALLTRIDNPNIAFGYAKRVLPAKREPTLLTIAAPLLVRVDVLEHDDDFEDFRPGTYRCDVRVEVGAKVGDEFRNVELSGTLTITLA